ncbi:MAG: HD domain-containing protein [Synergistaceae bacterium]|jgi:(p)ppGpp synthase/HD superfamily hydrolase|nr:HD domain-containing protein [Synergistaceae bacterium]
MLDHGQIFNAIDFAVEAHRGQFRKGVRAPYVFHPLNVGRLLMESGLGIEYAVAGILHDTIEDTETTAEEIAERFGPDVLELVNAATEKNRDSSWKERKLATLRELSLLDVRFLYVPCADKLDNMYASNNQLRLFGSSFWDHFRAPASEQRWYYSSLSSLFLRRLERSPCEHLSLELSRIVGLNFTEAQAE